MATLSSLLGSDVEWGVDLERTALLPGRVATGRLSLTPRADLEIRGLVVALVATEQWQYEVHSSGPNGTTTTHTETVRRELLREPVQLLEAGTLVAGQLRTLELALPVPPLGPATFDGTVTRLTWELVAKLDRAGPDASVHVPVTVLQPAALLGAGVIDLPAFALYPSADAAGDGISGTIALDPVPLCIGERFGGSVSFEVAGAVDVRGVRVAVVTHARATVSSGLQERLVLWECTVAGAEQLGGARNYRFEGILGSPGQPLLPTSLLPHGRSDAIVDVTLDRPWARDVHLRRDVAICSTAEL